MLLRKDNRRALNSFDDEKIHKQVWVKVKFSAF